MLELKHHFLIAMPTLQDPMFRRAVVYLCEHNDQGAMGIVINRPLPMTVSELLTQLKINPSGSELDFPVFYGGPVSTDRGFILHAPQDGFSSSLQISPETMLTNSRDILETLGTKKQPQRLLVALGYASWQQGQLEQELAENSWLTVSADPELIYSTSITQRWQQALQRIGIGNVWHLSAHAGHA